MGVDLGDLAIKHAISLESLSGRIIAVDAFNVLYQFLASIRQEDGTPLMDFRGNITAHLSGLFYRNAKLLENGIRPVYVFDGKPAELKERTHEERAAVKASARKKWEEALEKEEFREAKKYAQATSRLTPQMVAEAKELLTAMGIPWVQAEGEGEAQAAIMAQKGIVYAAASQDYDALLFGAPVLVRNISITGRRKVPRQDRYIMIEPEEIVLKETLAGLGVTREQLIMIGVLTGTDFNEGVRGVGPKTALKIVKEHKQPATIIDYIRQKYNYEFEVDPREILDLFMKPKEAEIPGKFGWGEVSEEDVVGILVRKHDFSEERVRRTTGQMIKSFKEKGEQKSLGQWFDG
ncbi:flap endonuclease-1 [Candidatus Micrarchaeota archaeon]|nr:flap endonuclease-1 [Candidatus Micrarchaeota archaeon]